MTDAGAGDRDTIRRVTRGEEAWGRGRLYGVAPSERGLVLPEIEVIHERPSLAYNPEGIVENLLTANQSCFCDGVVAGWGGYRADADIVDSTVVEPFADGDYVMRVQTMGRYSNEGANCLSTAASPSTRYYFMVHARTAVGNCVVQPRVFFYDELGHESGEGSGNPVVLTPDEWTRVVFAFDTLDDTRTVLPLLRTAGVFQTTFFIDGAMLSAKYPFAWLLGGTASDVLKDDQPMYVSFGSGVGVRVDYRVVNMFSAANSRSFVAPETITLARKHYVLSIAGGTGKVEVSYGGNVVCTCDAGQVVTFLPDVAGSYTFTPGEGTPQRSQLETETTEKRGKTCHTSWQLGGTPRALTSFRTVLSQEIPPEFGLGVFVKPMHTYITVGTTRNVFDILGRQENGLLNVFNSIRLLVAQQHAGHLRLQLQKWGEPMWWDVLNNALEESVVTGIYVERKNGAFTLYIRKGGGEIESLSIDYPHIDNLTEIYIGHSHETLGPYMADYAAMTLHDNPYEIDAEGFLSNPPKGVWI